ncbi:MAG: 4-hydroxy-tetrahydrodipicolinate synthase [Nitriliruptorales bacterium]|nr:4-hydroxy-tetrahydrodipicolinate synthase [Nitriliruptorales bacterium]
MLAFPHVMTAMATPMTADRALDLNGAQALAAHLVEHGNGGVVVAGTTGESPTLSHDETLLLFRAVVEAVGDRATVIAGCGKNDTAATVQLVRDASAVGVDGIMLVAPYYNKPSQRGLSAHFTEAAGATDLPVLLYNIPGRTACEIAPVTLLRLAETVPNIVGVKDAVDDFAKTAWLAGRAPAGFGIWSGTDELLLPLLAAGGAGVVSVAAHLVGDDFAAMVEVFPQDPEKARQIAFRIQPLCAALFAEPSPAPLKAALDMLGLPAGPVRPPLVRIEDATRVLLRDALANAGVALPDVGAAAEARR